MITFLRPTQVYFTGAAEEPAFKISDTLAEF